MEGKDAGGGGGRERKRTLEERNEEIRWRTM